MPRAFSEIAFTPSVRDVQSRLGSRRNYAALDHATERGDTLGPQESAFIAERDGFYQASVSETGWPYVQFRGGPTGFLKVLDERTIAYADFRGNVQYISAGNITADGRVSLILMDYAHRRRLKVWGRARLVDAAGDPGLIAQLEHPSYRARIERAVVIRVEAYDWNCPQHITPRFTEAEIAAATAPLHVQIADLRARLEQHAAPAAGTPAPAAAPAPVDQPVSVTLRRSGRTIAVPAGQSILDAVLDAGVDAPWSCRAGNCGTCAVKVLEGTPDHRDDVLSAEERDRAGLMCICVSRARTAALALDL